MYSCIALSFATLASAVGSSFEGLVDVVLSFGVVLPTRGAVPDVCDEVSFMTWLTLELAGKVVDLTSTEPVLRTVLDVMMGVVRKVGGLAMELDAVATKLDEIMVELVWPDAMSDLFPCVADEPPCALEKIGVELVDKIKDLEEAGAESRLVVLESAWTISLLSLSSNCTGLAAVEDIEAAVVVPLIVFIIDEVLSLGNMVEDVDADVSATGDVVSISDIADDPAGDEVIDDIEVLLSRPVSALSPELVSAEMAVSIPPKPFVSMVARSVVPVLSEFVVSKLVESVVSEFAELAISNLAELAVSMLAEFTVSNWDTRVASSLIELKLGSSELEITATELSPTNVIDFRLLEFGANALCVFDNESESEMSVLVTTEIEVLEGASVESSLRMGPEIGCSIKLDCADSLKIPNVANLELPVSIDVSIELDCETSVAVAVDLFVSTSVDTKPRMLLLLVEGGLSETLPQTQ